MVRAIVQPLGCRSRMAARIAAILLLFAALDAQAAQWFVQLGGASLAFSPQFTTITAGDTVTFYNVGGYHNVVADDGSFRCAHGCDGDGNGGSGNATDSLWIVTIAFPTPGTVGYFCEPHGSPGSGMYGTIEVVAPPPPPPVDPAPSSSVKLDALLALAVIVMALVRLRRVAADRALVKVGRRGS
jgi:plastocyanin